MMSCMVALHHMDGVQDVKLLLWFCGSMIRC